MDNNSLEKQNKIVKSYFQSVILGYLVNDLQTLLDPSLDNKHPGGCSAPLAMAVFSAMNQLGYLTSRKNTKVICEEARRIALRNFAMIGWRKQIQITVKAQYRKLWSIFSATG